MGDHALFLAMKITDLEKRISKIEREIAALAIKMKYIHEDLNKLKLSEIQSMEDILFPTTRFPHDP